MINFLEVNSIACGGTVIDGNIINIIRTLYDGIRIVVPIILIIVGMIGLGKAIAQQKEDEIKKAQSTLIKQAIAAAIVFLMFSLVSLLMSVIKANNNSNWACVSAILKQPKKDDNCYTIEENGVKTEKKWDLVEENGEKVWKCK